MSLHPPARPSTNATNSNASAAALERLLQQMNHPSSRIHAFEQLRRFVHNQRQQQQQQLQRVRNQTKQPAANAELSENRRGIRLTIDLPGVLANDVSVLREYGVLTVTACRKHYSLEGVCVKKQKVSRRYAVNTDVVDTERLTATLAHGVLTLEAPKKLASVQQSATGRISVAVSAEESLEYPIQVRGSDYHSTKTANECQVVEMPGTAKISPVNSTKGIVSEPSSCSE